MRVSSLLVAFILTALTRDSVGDVVLVVVMDTTSGTCGEPSAKGENSEELEATLRSFTEIVNKTFSQHFLITIVNSPCDTTDVTVHQVLDVIRHHDVIGILTMSRDPTISAILKLTKYLNTPVVEIVPGDVISRPQTRKNHLVLPHHTITVLQYTLAALKTLNWTSVHVPSTDSASAGRGVNSIFRKMAFGNQICVMPSSMNGAIPTVVFTDGDDFQETTRNDEKNTGPVLHVNLFPHDTGENKTWTNSSRNHLYLDISDSRFQQMVENLPRNCENGSEANTCELMNLFQNMADKDHPSFLMFAMGLSLTLSLQCPLMNMAACGNVSDTRTVRCYLLHYLCPEGDDQMGLVNFFLSRRSRRAYVHLRGADQEMHDEVTVGTETLFITTQLPAGTRDKDCGKYCHLCPSCLASETSRSKNLVSGEGVLYIAGFLPTRHPSQVGGCARQELSDQDKSHEFLEIFDVVRNQNNDILSIEGIVTDVCGSHSEPDNFQNDIAYCREILVDHLDNTNNRTRRLSIQPSQILAYIDTTGQLKPGTARKMVVSVDHSGYSSVEDLKISFVRNALTALRHLKWTVVNIVVSGGEPFLALLQHFKEASLSREFCYVNIIVARSGLTQDDLDIVVHSLEETTVYLLLTDATDTSEVLRKFRESWSPFREKVSLVFTPWNQYYLKVIDLMTFVDSYVILRPASVAPSDAYNEQNVDGLESQDYMTTRSVNKTRRRDEVITALVKQATQSLLSNWKRAARDDRHALDVTDTRLDVIAVKEDKQIHIATVGKELNLKENFTGQSRDTCRGWCPVCYACRNRGIPKRKSLYTKGDLILTGLFPISNSGTAPFRCGQVNLDIPHSQLVFAFMYALHTAKERYPDLLPGIHLGNLVMDTCSDSNVAIKMLIDFETCSTSFGKPNLFYELSNVGDKQVDNQIDSVNPVQNVGYVIDSSHVNDDIMKTVLQSLGDKPTAFVNRKLDMDSQLQKDVTQSAAAIAEILASLEETRVIIVFEDTPRYQNEAHRMSAVLRDESLCIVALLGFNVSETWRIDSMLSSYKAEFPSVLVTSDITAREFFERSDQLTSHFWIIPKLIEESSATNDGLFYPMGSIVIDGKPKWNKDFMSFLMDDLSSPKPKQEWYRQLWRMKYSCFFPDDTYRDPTWDRECSTYSMPADIANISSEINNVILSVDVLMHALHAQYIISCPEARGICPKFAEDIVSKRLSHVSNLTFLYQGQQLEYVNEGEVITTLSLWNIQKSGAIQFGTYFKGALSFNKTIFQFPQSYVPSSDCGTSCSCIDVTTDNRSRPIDPGATLYDSSQGEIIYEIWTIAVFSVAASGALVSLLFSIYVVYKICSGALGRHYIGLGLTLLFALILLYSSVLPYMFTPSAIVCSLRYFWPGAAYAFCFAVVFVKLMTLQNYKLIGLGGEVSGINQFASVFFVTVVQVASSVQWWIYNTPSVYSITSQSGIVKFACNFNKPQFSCYLIYVMFLLLLCSVYAIGVRHEKKNMGEAKLLMTSSWACSAIWVVWLLCFFLMDRKWSEAIICAGIVTCATVVLLVVFLPKLRMVSRLKYDLSQKNHARNGCSVDTDFLYERPHSLPGTLTSTFSSGKMNCPKTLTNTDSAVNTEHGS